MKNKTIGLVGSDNTGLTAAIAQAMGHQNPDPIGLGSDILAQETEEPKMVIDNYLYRLPDMPDPIYLSDQEVRNDKKHQATCAKNRKKRKKKRRK